MPYIKPTLKTPKVSILCVTYNQEKYIEQALESFVNQVTDFEFEVLVDDDCSTDGTQEIIRRFETKYPNIIKPTYRSKNVGVYINGREIYFKAKGKYVCLCQGDDFFCDNHKLQLQANFLDKNPDYSICFHPTKIFYEDKSQADSIFPELRDPDSFTIELLLRRNFMGCNSVMYVRRDDFSLPENIAPDDYYIHLYNAQFGKIGFINQTMSCYRVHSEGVWYASHNEKENLFKHYGDKQLKLFEEVLKMFGDNKNYANIVFENMDYILNVLKDIDDVEGTNLFHKSLSSLNCETIVNLLQYSYIQRNLLNNALTHSSIKLRPFIVFKSRIVSWLRCTKYGNAFINHLKKILHEIGLLKEA